jgi:hypothetical protein
MLLAFVNLASHGIAARPATASDAAGLAAELGARHPGGLGSWKAGRRPDSPVRRVRIVRSLGGSPSTSPGSSRCRSGQEAVPPRGLRQPSRAGHRPAASRESDCCVSGPLTTSWQKLSTVPVGGRCAGVCGSRSVALRELSSAQGSVRAGVSAHRAEAGAQLRPCHSKRDEKRGTEGREGLFDGDPADVRDGRAGHWKISVVQSPPWRRTSWALAGPSRRSWKSTKKSGSTSIPPSGEQSTRISHERSPG